MPLLEAAELVVGGLSQDKAVTLAYKKAEEIEKTEEFNNMAAKNLQPVCPTCKKPTQVTYNWFQDNRGIWYHECWMCENVFYTTSKVIEKG